MLSLLMTFRHCKTPYYNIYEIPRIFRKFGIELSLVHNVNIINGLAIN